MVRKGQFAGNAAAFVAIVTVAIILYILFLPPDIRTEILGDPRTGTNGSGNGGNGGVISTTNLLRQNVGRVTYINTNEKTYDLPTTRIYTPTSGQVLKNVPSINLRYAIFDNVHAKYDVELELDEETTKNLLLSFNVRSHYGPITISLNGKEIFSGEISDFNPKPIVLDQDYLEEDNVITLSVPSPGLAFWNANKYAIENLQITGDVTDYSTSSATQYFTISSVEKENLESLRLFFYPSCNLKDVGSLKIDLNGRSIYNSVADCGTRTFAVLDTDDIIAGSNELKFSSSKGSYTLDNMYIKTQMDKPAYRTYYFDIDAKYFINQDVKARCGDYDNECPSGCDASEDADCCFDDNGYWCSLPTLNFNDRCRYYVADDDCDICKTGYYDKSGDAPSNCEDTPGDNNDGLCLGTTPQPNRFYDADCCYAEDEDNFWCAETPITGIQDKCKASVAPGECDLCPSGYENEDGSSPDSCANPDMPYVDEDHILSSDYEVKLTVRFTEETTRKKVDLIVNGYTFRIDTTGIEYTKIISNYVRDGTNSIEIRPVNDDIDIAEIKVDLRKIR
ncbi:MAG TPA: hypothetical protein VEC16_03095 [Alphaproteobacteria bacterium]|nr:hypothetical protein [Alphaproteobacteria bacterium]